MEPITGAAGADLTGREAGQLEMDQGFESGRVRFAKTISHSTLDRRKIVKGLSVAM